VRTQHLGRSHAFLEAAGLVQQLSQRYATARFAIPFGQIFLDALVERPEAAASEGQPDRERGQRARQEIRRAQRPPVFAALKVTFDLQVAMPRD
jgi:hypothetical protein